jgi:hypothetical protein
MAQRIASRKAEGHPPQTTHSASLAAKLGIGSGMVASLSPDLRANGVAAGLKTAPIAGGSAQHKRSGPLALPGQYG